MVAARLNAASRTLNTTMSTSPPEREHSDDSNPPPGTYSSTPRRPIYQTETTGNYWVDVREAFKVRPINNTSRLAFRLFLLLITLVLTLSRYDGIVEIVAI